MYEIKEDVSWDYVFSKVSQEQVFEKYLGIKVQFKRLFRNPLRKDDNPTCGFKYFDGVLIFTDFAGYFKGNCVKLVMKMFNLKYYEALNKILEDTQFEPKLIFNRQNTKQGTSIEIKKRVFNNLDKEYWSQFAISSDTLKFFNVVPAEIVWLDGNIIYTYNKKDPAYAYKFKDKFKIYFPFRKNFRFISNTQAIQGYEQLPGIDKSRDIIITKSLKDVMVLYELGILSIALQSEVVMPEEELISELKERFRNIYLLYDFDLTGIRTSNKIRRKYNIKQLFLTNGRLNSVNYGAKDISDFIKIHGVENTKKLINDFQKLGRI